ncbi:thiol reductant ABC exporter subunit CydC [Humibacter sp.]|uniref:thiol reductant ABC exporter subunit CydC n=2 Tax=Humibacter sp. TaxID=1940291 RepID=UPI003F81A7C8
MATTTPATPGAGSTRPSPVDGVAEVGTKRLLLLGLLGALKALGLVLVADALATGIVTVIAHGDVSAAVLEGLGGALVRALAVWGLRVVSQSAAAGVKQGLRILLARSYLRRRSGGVGADTALAATGLDDLDAYYTSYLPSLVSAATVPLLVGARILAADWVSALVVVLTVPLIPLFMALIGLHTRHRVAASLDALGRLSDHLVELARGLPVLVGLGRDREQSAALAEISESHRAKSMTALRTAFLSSLALDLLSTISVAVVAVIIGVRLLGGDLPLEAGLVALILAPECYAPLRDVGAAFHASDTGREALRRARAAFSRPVARNNLTRRSGASVVVHEVTVRYQGRTEPAVDRLSFRAPEGAVTLLAGDSGAGKSTVLAVLAGRGAALDDDAEVAGGVVAPRPERTAWMPQHPHFSSRTVLDEVRLYGPDKGFGAADARALLDRVGLAGLADSDPAELSPGEARRLAFTRILAAVTAGARLVLLDEPTAHLDADSAAGIRREIARLRGRVTVLVASHDPAVRLLADRVVSIGTSANSFTKAEAPDGTIGDVAAIDSGAGAPEEAAGEPTAGPGTRRPDKARGVVSELVAFLRPVSLRMLAAVLVGVLSSGFAIALTALSGWLIVRASQEPAIMYLLVAIVGVRFFGIGRSALRYAERLLTHDAVFRATTALRLCLWRALAEAGPAGRRALSPSNALATLVGAADRARDLIPRVVQPPAAAAVVVAGAAATLGALHLPALGVVAGLAVIALGGAPAVAFAAGRSAARQTELARSAVLTAFTDLLVARDDLTPAAAERVIRRIDDAGAAAARGERRIAHAEGVASALVVLACCAAAVVMLPLAAPSIASGALRPELVAVLVLVPLALIEPLLDGVAAACRAPALAGVLSQVHAATNASAGVSHRAGVSVAPGAVQGIRLDGVSFQYPGATHPVFTGIDTSVSRGEWLAVTGPSGSGKSTLLSLLLRFADPLTGHYLLDEETPGSARARTVDARTVPPNRLRTRVAWCPQEGHLFDSTLRANLVIARPRSERPGDDELLDALDRVGLAPLVATLPLGLDTRIGPAGEHLSGGQRQRVAVARTLLARGDVVLIDEPTAQLDEQASAALIADLRTALRDRTTVLVTHDAEQARRAEHVIELSGTATGRARPAPIPHTAAA